MRTSSSSNATDLGLPRNYLRPCLLLLLSAGPAHGYDLLLQLPDLGLRRVDPGGLYRCLRAMEEEGLVISHWEEGDAGPARRTYELLDGDGLEWLHLWASSVRDVRRSLHRFLARYGDVAAPTHADATEPTD